MDFKPSEKEKENIIVRTPPRPLSIAYFTALNTSLNLTARPPPVHIFTALVEPNGITSTFPTALHHRFFPFCSICATCLYDRSSSFSFPSSSYFLSHFTAPPMLCNILLYFFLCASIRQTSKGVLKNCSQWENSLSFQTCRIGRVCVLYSIYFLSGQIFMYAWHPLLFSNFRSRRPALSFLSFPLAYGTISETPLNNGYPPTSNDVTHEI